MRIETSRNELVPAPLRVPAYDFWLVIAATTALLALMVLGERAWYLQPVRMLLGLIYILFAPGYCLTIALFPRTDDLDTVERLGLSFGLSIALIPVLALLLDWLPSGIHPWPILAAEYSIIALSIIVALWRRSRLPRAAAYTPYLTWHSWSRWRSLLHATHRRYRWVAVVLVLLSLMTAWIVLLPSPETHTTEFYALGKGGRAEDYPRQAGVGDELSVTMGIVNRERDAHTYRVEIWVADPWHAGQRALVSKHGPMTLVPGQSLERPVSWHMPWAGDDQQVDLLLFVDDGPDPYRRLRLWLNVVE